MSHQNVLDKLLRTKNVKPLPEMKGEASTMVEDFFRQKARSSGKPVKKAGRPVVEDKKRAKNFTVCMAVNYIAFLDTFRPPIKKIQGRGRKLRFIIDEFIKMSKRQRSQLKYLQEALKSLQEVLTSFSGAVKKGEKLSLTPREKQMITTHVNRVKLLTQLLCFNHQELKKILPPEDWNLYSFCLNWNESR